LSCIDQAEPSGVCLLIEKRQKDGEGQKGKRKLLL